MIKTKEKGGMFGKTLAAACSLALVASLTPAAALTALAAPTAQTVPDTVTVTLRSLDAQGRSHIIKSVDVTDDPSTVSNVKTTAKTADAIFYADDNYGVATAVATKAATFQSYIAAVLGDTWSYNPDTLKKLNPTITIRSGYKAPTTNSPLPAGVYEDLIKPVTTDWNTLSISQQYYPNVEYQKFVSTGGTQNNELPVMVDADNSVFNSITATGGTSEKASVVAANNATAAPESFGFAFIAGMPQNEANTAPQAGASRMVQGVNGITITIPYTELENINRVAGTNWDDTMGDIVDDAVENGSFTNQNTFVIATANGYEDALAASGFAGLLGAPLLMTDRDQLTQETADLIKATKGAAAALTIYVIGGSMAVSDDVVKALEALPGVNNTSAGSVVRIAGENSWDTALEVYKAGAKIGSGWTTKDLVVATSIDFQDALSISPYAYAEKVPVVLTTNNAILSDSVAEYLQNEVADGKIETAKFAGGSVVVSNAVSDQLRRVVITRLAGATAYDTSNAIAEYLTDADNALDFANATGVCIATGLDYLDALSSCNWTGTQKQVLLLADSTNQTTIDKFLTDNSVNADPAGKIASATIFGGTAVVSNEVAVEANAVLSK